MIIEKVTGLSYEDAVRKIILNPLKMIIPALITLH
jgi:CubicO group peptidase (beta-lactamase class C family)